MNDRKAHDLAWITLLRAPGLGFNTLRAALTECPDVVAMTRHSMATLRALGFSDAAALHVLQPPGEQVLRDLQWLEESGACLLPFTAAAYPPALAALPDAPPALYVLGDVGLLGRPQLAIVGSRHPTAAGRRFAADIAAPLCAAGLVITSGLARGIDAAAHEAAL
ncbi:MAG: DNA-processing protein DprA, partial [Steroidobacteraceae bacterium]